jgi:plasmid stabilization system protein ParE
MIAFRIADAGLADVEEILQFFRAPSGLGDAFNRDIGDAIHHLRQWPYTGHRRRDLTKADVCFWFFDPYFLVVRIDNNLLSIVAVLHSSRHIARILKKRFKTAR